jgi:TetR/AcrR family transcriptional regulator, mexJK operon transcriptional repressor
MTIRKTSKSPGEKRRQAIIDAAYSLFVEKGYPAVTVDEIIKISGGSKTTLYKFFGSKEGVLKAVTETLAKKMLKEIAHASSTDGNPREELKRIGLNLSKLVLSAEAINQYRLAVVNAMIYPDIAMLWYESGPRTTFEGVAEYLEKETAAGRLKVRNPMRAAHFLLGMIFFKDNLTMSIGAKAPPESEMEAIVNEAVDVFLAAYVS